MRCYEDEGSWSLSFSGAGFLGLYHVGVTRCLSERAPHLLQGARRFYGSSSGALNAITIIAGKSVGAWGTARTWGYGGRERGLHAGGRGRGEGRFRAWCLALCPAPFTSNMIPGDPEKAPEDWGTVTLVPRTDQSWGGCSQDQKVDRALECRAGDRYSELERGKTLQSHGTREGGQVFGTDVGRPPGDGGPPPLPTPADFCCSHLLGMVKQVDRLSLGILHPAFAPIEHIRQQLQDSLPSDIHILASQRLGISLTRWPDGHNIIVTDFATRDEVIQVSLWWDPWPRGR